MDSAEFADWVRPHLLAMTRLAARLSGDTSADDVVQESLVRAWRRRSTFDPARGGAGPWLLAITADRARRHRVRERPSARLVDLAGQSPDVERRLDIEAAIARLPRQQRLAVELHYFVGLALADSAQVLGCATGTVKSHLSDARRRLRADLEEPS